MVASAAVSAGRTKLPTFTLAGADAAGNRRADFGEVQLDLQIFQRRAVRLRGRARDIDLGLRVVERDLGGGVLGEQVRCSAATSRSACSSCACAPAITASTRLISASIWRLSSVNRRSPSFTRAPSGKCTPVMTVSTRALIATLAIGVTVPSASSAHRHLLRGPPWPLRPGSTALAALAAATARSGLHRLRVKRTPAATAAKARQRRSTQRPFAHDRNFGPGLSPRRASLCPATASGGHGFCRLWPIGLPYSCYALH